jgi:hypothetical protein
MKIKLFRVLTHVLCIVVISISVKAQNGNTNYFQPNIFPSGPNSMAFTKFGNYPVNLYSGLPDISIPLYTIESGGLSIPITLSYHASGNRIADVASWVGLGWSINTGGSITRNIMGLPDDNGYLQGDMRMEDSLKMGNHPISNWDLNFFHATIGTRGWDNMPDIYSYQVPGYSGKFFFDGTNNYKIEKIPFSPIKITGLTGSNGTGGFDITDTHGNVFILGHTVTETTGTPIGGGTPAMNGISAWMLEQMIAQNRRDTIKFAYTPDFLTYPDGLSENFSVEDSYTQGQSPGYSGYVNNTLTPNIINNPSTVTEQQLNTITFKNGKVSFILSSAGRQDVGNSGSVHYLSTIQVSVYNFGTKMYEVQKSIVFYQSYFNTGMPGALRLRLDSIQIQDKAGSVIQHYHFTYNGNVNLPAYGSLARDFWGYYNGKITATDLIPQTNIQINTPQNINNPLTYINIGSNDPNSRNPDSVAMQANILTRIDYPTGGYSTFNYQTNQYYDSSNNLQLAGGLRIKSISSFDSPTSTTPVMVKTYQYDKARANFINNGAPLLNYGLFQNSQTYRWWAQINDGQGSPSGIELLATKRVRHFFAQPNEDLAPDAIPVAYSVVTEYDGTSTRNIGKTVYTYTDYPPDNWQTAYRTGIPITYSFFFSRGQLLEKKTYMNKPGNTYQVVKDETNSYTAFGLRYYNGVGLAIGQNNYNDGILTGAVAYPNQEMPDDISSNTYPWNYYDILSDDNYLTRSTTTTYDTADTTKFTTSSVTYRYNDTTHQQITSTIHVDSKGNTHISSNKYAYDYLNGGSTTHNVVLDSMISRYMYADPVEKWDSLQNAATSVNAVIGAQLNQFQFGTITNTIVPSKISTLSVSSPLINFAHSSVVSGNLTGDSRYAQMISFDHYDGQNNITQYTPRNATPTAIMWDYQSGVPVAQVKNVPAFSSSITYYAYTSFEADGKGNWNYNGTPLTDQTAPTGSYSYPLSAGSISTGVLGNTYSYVVSYWSNNGAATVSYQSNNISGTALRTANGWTYYEHQIPSGGVGSGVTVSGSTSIDDLRLYPASAQMTTYAYDPSGLRSIADTRGAINYFEYDYFQRLKNAKDWNGNIVKNYGYHTYDQTIGNDAMSATFTRNNCPAGTSPQSALWSVPVAKYLSSTKASANADATYDLNVNGQLNANRVCSCTATTIPFIIHNNTAATFTITFSNISPFTNILPSDSTIYIAPNTYTLTINPNDSSSHTYTLGTSGNVLSGHNVTFPSVNIATGSSELFLTIQ